MQVVFRKDPIVPSVEAIEDLKRCVDYWGDKCCKAEAENERLRAIVRVNGLRLGHTHAEIDALLAESNGDRNP